MSQSLALCINEREVCHKSKLLMWQSFPGCTVGFGEIVKVKIESGHISGKKLKVPSRDS